MNSTRGPQKLPPRWLMYIACWLLLTVVFASQLYWSGYAPWPTALWLEGIHWLSWGAVTPLVFWLTRRLHQGGHDWRRYAIGLGIGALVVSVLQSTLMELIAFAKEGCRRAAVSPSSEMWSRRRRCACSVRSRSCSRSDDGNGCLVRRTARLSIPARCAWSVSSRR